MFDFQVFWWCHSIFICCYDVWIIVLKLLVMPSMRKLMQQHCWLIYFPVKDILSNAKLYWFSIIFGMSIISKPDRTWMINCSAKRAGFCNPDLRIFWKEIVDFFLGFCVPNIFYCQRVLFNIVYHLVAQLTVKQDFLKTHSKTVDLSLGPLLVNTSKVFIIFVAIIIALAFLRNRSQIFYSPWRLYSL